MNPVITCRELAERLGEPEVRILDLRGQVSHQELGDGFEKGIYQGAYQDYLASHIPGAVFVDWTTDLVDPTQSVKAQVANPEQFAQAMGRAGVTAATEVVIYDQGVAQFATRLWWALHYYGHRQVRVLDGGWSAWQQSGYPVTSQILPMAATSFIPQVNPAWRIEPDELLALLNQNNPNLKIIDARPLAHYQGERSRASRKGHIPTALNLPRPDLLQGAHFKSLAQWQQHFQALGLTPEDTVVSYCNGGVAASTILFALHALGYERLRLYDGSWNEWGARADLPLA